LIDDGLYNVIYYDTYKDLFSITRKGNYDLFIELTQDYTPLFKQLRNMFIIRISGVSHAFGWGVQSIKRLSKWQEECGLITSENDRLNKVLAKESIIINSTDACYDFKISKSDKNIVDNLYHSLSLDKNEKVITFVVGAKRPMNIWPIGYFVEVAKYLISQDYNILLVGGKGDVDNAAQLIKLKGVINIIGKTTPIQTGLIMSKTKLVISNDTGGMHLSYTFNTPVVAIFSSRDCSVKWYPPNKSSKVFKAESINCSHCFSETCIDNICMKSIKPEHIINYLKEVGF
jgi:ADP-heptose:LPS heptosyltransferase